MHSNSAGLIYLALFVAGAMLFVLGTLRVRRERARREAVPATLRREDRLDTIERLAIVGQPWCIDELRAICEKDPDPVVREAADAALIVVGARA
ncbi:MAG TPA: hypothetical protein VF741_03560 [Candidatus Aquilonibacter sp.]